MGLRDWLFGGQRSAGPKRGPLSEEEFARLEAAMRGQGWERRCWLPVVEEGEWEGGRVGSKFCGAAWVGDEEEWPVPHGWEEAAWNAFCDAAAEKHGAEFPREVDKVAGWPRWVQGEWKLDCPSCGVQTVALVQIGSEDHVPHMFGDVGIGHVFV